MSEFLEFFLYNSPPSLQSKIDNWSGDLDFADEKFASIKSPA
jgi:hypothetical protein